MEKCNEKCEVYSRVTGYFRPVANWNKGKQEEFAERKAYRVAKAVLLLFGLLVLVLVAGCGHNTVSYGDGVMLETTVNPESYAFGVSFRYGKILTACVRENAEVEMQGAGSGSAGTGGETGNAAGASGTGTVKLRIGKQITGYYVDALKAGASREELDAYRAPAANGGNPDKPTAETATAAKTPENAK